MTAAADARHRAGPPVRASVPLLAIDAQNIERAAAARDVYGVDRTLDGRGHAPDVLEHRTRLPVRDRAQRAAADARADRAPEAGVRDRQRNPSRRPWAAITVVQRPCRTHRQNAPIVLDVRLVVASQRNARVWSVLRFVELWWFWSSSGLVRSAVAGGC